MKKQIIDWWTGGQALTPLVSGYSAAWGVKRLSTTYNGAAIRIKRSSDNAETDINFASASLGANLSKSEIDSFTSNLTISTTVVTIYDQSGNGYNLTVEAARVGAFLVYDSSYGFHYLHFGYANDVVYQIPAGLSVSTQNCSLYNVVAKRKSGTGIEAYWDWGTNNLLYYQSDFNTRSIYDGSAESFTAKDIMNTTDATVHSVRCTASNVKLNIDGRHSSTAAALTNATPAGGRIGRWTGSATFAAQYSWFMGLVYGSALTDGNDTTNVSAIKGYFSKSTSYTKLVVCLGDSLIEGAVSGAALRFYETWPVIVKRQYTDTVRFVNSGNSGDTLVQMNTARATRATDLIALDSFTRKVAVVWGGTNDINSGTSGATAHGTLQTLCTNLKSGGFDKVVVCDIIPRGPFSGAQNTEKDAFNTLVAANYATYADAFAQLSALSWVYGTHYAADQIHLNAAGNTLASSTIKTAIDSVI